MPPRLPRAPGEDRGSGLRRMGRRATLAGATPRDIDPVVIEIAQPRARTRCGRGRSVFSKQVRNLPLDLVLRGRLRRGSRGGGLA
eukprot:4800780-Alexandrium_andersonii.AAC.1